MRPQLSLQDVTFKANMGGAMYTEGAIVTLEKVRAPANNPPPGCFRCVHTTCSFPC